MLFNVYDLHTDLAFYFRKQNVLKISTALTPHDIVNKFSLQIIIYNRKIYQWSNCGPSFDFKQ